MIAVMFSAVPTLYALVRGLQHDTHTIESIAIHTIATFVISFALVFFAQVAGGRWSKRGLEVSLWFVWFIIGAAILYVPGMIIFHHWAGSLVLAAGWLIVLLSIRALVQFWRSKPDERHR
jgi:hypothetical protein